MKLPIEATEYYLTSPEQFEKKTILIDKIPRGHTMLKTLYTAICGSDLQYYKGEKSEEKLRTRLPLIPLHEGVCIDLKKGKRVVPIAGDFRKVPFQFFQKENTWPQLPYLGATMPGLARTHLLYPEELIVAVPKSVSDTVASVVEPLSIALRSCSEMNIRKNEPIAIIGTGGVAFLIGVVLRYFFHIPKKNVFINIPKSMMGHSGKTCCDTFCGMCHSTGCSGWKSKTKKKTCRRHSIGHSQCAINHLRNKTYDHINPEIFHCEWP